jgi:hypothetical protein
MWQYQLTGMSCKRKQKRLKCNSLSIEIKRTWNMRCVIIPVVIGATGVVTKGVKNNVEAIPGKHSVDPIKKTSVLVTSHIIRKVLQSET